MTDAGRGTEGGRREDGGRTAGGAGEADDGGLPTKNENPTLKDTYMYVYSQRYTNIHPHTYICVYIWVSMALYHVFFRAIFPSLVNYCPHMWVMFVPIFG